MVWWRVVLDEAQNIKDQKAQRSLAAFNLKVSLRLCCLEPASLLSIRQANRLIDRSINQSSHLCICTEDLKSHQTSSVSPADCALVRPSSILMPFALSSFAIARNSCWILRPCFLCDTGLASLASLACTH